MFKDPIDCYQHIGSHLRQIPAEPWLDIRVELELDEEMTSSISSYQPRRSNSKRVEIAAGYEVHYGFRSLARIISTPEKGLFKKCVFILHDDGRYNADFVY